MTNPYDERVRDLEERVMFAEKERDAAQAETLEVRKQAKEKAKRTGQNIAGMRKAFEFVRQSLRQATPKDIAEALIIVEAVLEAEAPSDLISPVNEGAVRSMSALTRTLHENGWTIREVSVTERLQGHTGSHCVEKGNAASYYNIPHDGHDLMGEVCALILKEAMYFDAARADLKSKGFP